MRIILIYIRATLKAARISIDYFFSLSLVLQSLKSSKKITLAIFAGLFAIAAIAVITFSKLTSNSGIYHPPPPNASGP
ncbi:MAG: hypothetical protein AAFR31_22305, partial [Cyanobacteria bacterium J06627_8]